MVTGTAESTPVDLRAGGRENTLLPYPSQFHQLALNIKHEPLEAILIHTTTQ